MIIYMVFFPVCSIITHYCCLHPVNAPISHHTHDFITSTAANARVFFCRITKITHTIYCQKYIGTCVHIFL